MKPSKEVILESLDNQWNGDKILSLYCTIKQIIPILDDLSSRIEKLETFRDAVYIIYSEHDHGTDIFKALEKVIKGSKL